MGLYVLLMFYLLLLYLVDISSLQKKSISFIAILPFFTLSALRSYSIGNDTASYLAIFERVKLNQIDLLNTNFEIGYVKLNQLIALLFSNNQSILIVTSFFIYLGYFFFINKFSLSPVFSIFLFLTLGYFGSSVNLIRQQLALGLIFLAWNYLRENRLIISIAFILLASLFHNTALVFLFAILIRKVKVNKSSLLISLSFIILGYISYKPILNLFLKIFPAYNNYLSSIYMNGEIRIATVMNIVILLLILLFGIIMKPHLDTKKLTCDDWNQMTLYIIVSIGLTVLSLKFNLIARTADYFSVFTIIYIPYLVRVIRNTKLKLVIGFMIILFCAGFFFFIQLYRPEWNVIYPYNFYRQEW